VTTFASRIGLPRRRAQRDDRGVIVLLFALLASTIFIFGALSVGLGNVRQEQRSNQNDVDAAVLAASVEFDGVIEDPVDLAERDRAVAVACHYLTERNDLDGECTADLFEYPVNADGEPAVEGDDECIRIAVSESARAFFGEIIDRPLLEVASRAVGCRGAAAGYIPPTPAVEPIPAGPPRLSEDVVPAAFAGGTNCSGSDPGIDTSGNHQRFVGAVHANSNPKDGGSGNSATPGPNTYAGSTVVQSGSMWSTANREQVSVQPWPHGFHPSVLTVALYQPGGERARAYGGFYSSTTGSRTFAGATPAGVYYVGGKIEVKGGFSITPRTETIHLDPMTGLPALPVTHGGTGQPRTRTLTGVTLVGNGDMIVFGDDNVRIQPFEYELNRLAIYNNWNGGVTDSSKWCTNTVIEFGGGDCVHFDGIIYAPRGAIGFSGNGNGHWHNERPGCASEDPGYAGGLIGYGLKFNGERHLIRSGPGHLIPGDPPVPGNEGTPGQDPESGEVFLGGPQE
jgi:hypothetical protein